MCNLLPSALVQYAHWRLWDFTGQKITIFQATPLFVRYMTLYCQQMSPLGATCSLFFTNYVHLFPLHPDNVPESIIKINHNNVCFKDSCNGNVNEISKQEPFICILWSLRLLMFWCSKKNHKVIARTKLKYFCKVLMLRMYPTGNNIEKFSCYECILQAII